MEKRKKGKDRGLVYHSKVIIVKGQTKRVAVLKGSLSVVKSTRVFYNHRRNVPTF
jgi:hypothetical protein